MELTIHIPGNVLPLDRGKRFSDPLDAALRGEKVGELGDEGAQMGIEDGRYIVVGCDIHLRVTDVALALAVIRRVLREAAAPPTTTITQRGEPSVVHHL